jgi:hypothetical protein
MITILATLGVLALLFLASIGVFVLYHIFRPKREPADASNRINHIRLVWFVT